MMTLILVYSAGKKIRPSLFLEWWLRPWAEFIAWHSLLLWAYDFQIICPNRAFLQLAPRLYTVLLYTLFLEWRLRPLAEFLAWHSLLLWAHDFQIICPNRAFLQLAPRLYTVLLHVLYASYYDWWWYWSLINMNQSCILSLLSMAPSADGNLQ